MKEQLKIKKKYFWLVIIGAGSSGIWLMFLISLFKGIGTYPIEDLPSNLTTYFLGILVSGCIEKGIKLFESESNRSANEFMNIIIVMCFTFLLVLFSVLSTLNDYFYLALILSSVGVYLAFRVWWNINIKSLDDPAISILGGQM